MPDDSDRYLKGSALVGMALAQLLLTVLRAKGVLSDAEADGILEETLSGLETKLPNDDPAVRQARMIVELIARAARSQ